MAAKSGIVYTYTYELTDHLGNMRAVIGRTKVLAAADIKNWQDYFPHGSVMPGRQGISGSTSRNGYQGQYAEKDPETGYDAFDLRLYDSRIGRWLSTDPDNQYWSLYMANGNNPVSTVDPTGGTGYSGGSGGGYGGGGPSGYGGTYGGQPPVSGPGPGIGGPSAGYSPYSGATPYGSSGYSGGNMYGNSNPGAGTGNLGGSSTSGYVGGTPGGFNDGRGGGNPNNGGNAPTNLVNWIFKQVCTCFV